MTDYPQHDKVRALNGANQTVGDFLEWLGNNGYTVCEQADRAHRYETGQHLRMTHTTREQFICRFFDLDADALSREKDQMFEELQATRATHAEMPDHAGN